jgi:hypothetical protein
VYFVIMLAAKSELSFAYSNKNEDT